MGRNKTRKKHQRNQTADDHDPDVSETDPSSSENVSSSLNETTVLNSGSNMMDTDAEDSELATGNSTPADESQPNVGSHIEGKSSGNSTFPTNVNNGEALGDSVDVNATGNTLEVSNLWTDEPIKQSCSHTKASASMPGMRKAMKGDMVAVCSARPCESISDPDKEIGAGDSEITPLKAVFMYNFGIAYCFKRVRSGRIELKI